MSFALGKQKDEEEVGIYRHMYEVTLFLLVSVDCLNLFSNFSSPLVCNVDERNDAIDAPVVHLNCTKTCSASQA